MKLALLHLFQHPWLKWLRLLHLLWLWSLNARSYRLTSSNRLPLPEERRLLRPPTTNPLVPTQLPSSYGRWKRWRDFFLTLLLERCAWLVLALLEHLLKSDSSTLFALYWQMAQTKRFLLPSFWTRTRVEITARDFIDLALISITDLTKSKTR